MKHFGCVDNDPFGEHCSGSMTTPGNGGAPRLAAIIDELDRVRTSVDTIEHEVVTLIRDGGATWEDIGEELGISRQAARQRFAKLRRRR